MKKLLIILLITILELTSFPEVVVYAQEATGSAQTQEVTSSSGLADLTLDPAKESSTSATALKSLVKLPNSAPSATIKLPVKVRILKKQTFRSDEKITVVVDNAQASEIKALLVDKDGHEISVDIETISDQDPVVIKFNPPLDFKPGKYTLKVTDAQGQISEQDFNWGVLAINTNKSIYSPHEQAKLAMAVLDERGEMVCDASVKLEIRNPKSQTAVLSTDNGKIKVNPECQIKDFTLKPDYEAEYQVGEVGSYDMTLTAQTKNGTFTITDAFEVRESVPFDVERVTATRIFPAKEYPVTFNITANLDFAGTVTEFVPESFAIKEATGSAKAYDQVELVSIDQAKIPETLSIPDLGLPFEGTASATLYFGEQLKDPSLKTTYFEFGVAGHDGVDFEMPAGTPVLAVDDGVVVRVRKNDDYGDTVVVRHAWGKSYYGHLSKFKVEQGQRVSKGNIIALSGNTGLTTGPHLHFGIKPHKNQSDNGYFGKIDPLPFLGLERPGQLISASTNQSIKQLSWNLKLKKGDHIKLGYQFKAPDKSPEFYKLGPMRFIDLEEKIIFQEARLWQIAADVTTGPNYAGAAGTNGFTLPANAVGSVETSCTGDDYGDAIVSGFWNTFGFAIPTGDTINGITVEVKWAYSSDPPAAGDTGITVVKSETSLGTEQTFATAEPAASTACGATQEIDTKGGVADLWGLTWTPAEINATTFGVRIRKSIAGGEHGLNINWIRVTITHTAGGAESPTQSQLMRHGKWFNSAGVEQAFTF